MAVVIGIQTVKIMAHVFTILFWSRTKIMITLVTTKPFAKRRCAYLINSMKSKPVPSKAADEPRDMTLWLCVALQRLKDIAHCFYYVWSDY